MASTLEQSHTIKLTLIDTQNKYIDSKDFTVTYRMFSLPDQSDVIKQSFYQNAAFLKLNYFIISILDGSLVFKFEDMPLAQKFLSEYENNFMVLPELDDMTVLEVLHRKFSSLVGDHTYVSRVSITDQLTKVTYHSEHLLDEDSVDSLPSVQEWLGELSFWDQPWWDRYDILTFDNVALDIEERDEHRSSSSRQTIVAPLDDIDEQVKTMLDKAKDMVEGNTTEKKQGEIISLDSVKNKSSKWKPTIV